MNNSSLVNQIKVESSKTSMKCQFENKKIFLKVSKRLFSYGPKKLVKGIEFNKLYMSRLILLNLTL